MTVSALYIRGFTPRLVLPNVPETDSDAALDKSSVSAYVTKRGVFTCDLLSQRMWETTLLLDDLQRNMTENQSITGRLKNELMNNLAVSIVAVLLAFVALALTAVSESITGELYIALNIAVWIPYAYEAYWPVKYSTGAAAAWTVCAALITSGLYIGSYLVAANFLSSDIIPAIAFVVTIAIQFGIVVLFARIRRNT